MYVSYVSYGSRSYPVVNDQADGALVDQENNEISVAMDTGNTAYMFSSHAMMQSTVHNNDYGVRLSDL